MSDNPNEVTFEEPTADALAFDVSEEEAGARLDAFLASRVEGVSRTTLKRAADDGDVLVGGKPAKPSYRVQAGEHVEVELPAPPASDIEPEDIPLDIVYEDEEVVVVNKPAGMVVHPASGVRTGTLANAVAYRLQASGAGSRAPGSSEPTPDARHTAPSQRPGIVHRLDRDTSGLIVVALTPRAHENLSDQFRARTVFKSYAALVHGVVKEDKGKIEQPIGRDPRHRTRMGVVRTGRAAVSIWKARRRFERMTLLDVEIKTGRTHQIRVHLAWMNHPVVGDETYGGGRDKNLHDPRLRSAVASLGRQFLHAARLGFHHPATGQWLSFDAPLPADLAGLLEQLK